MAGGNSTTRFELFFLIFWILLTCALLAMVMLRKIRMPALLHGNKWMSLAFAFLQFCIFVFLLTGLALDRWSIYDFTGGWVALGVAREHDSDGNGSRYTCDGVAQSTPCHTVIAAGAFTLIFGLVAIITSFVLTVTVILSLFGVLAIDRMKAWVDVLANVQWISMLAMVMIWGISAHNVTIQINGSRPSGFDLGASWILVLVGTILAIGAALFFAGGPGETIKGGETSAPATSMGPPPVTTQAGPAHVV